MGDRELPPKCVIVMATYNGGDYLREQLDSILAQTYQGWRLFVSDDGSVDSTHDILLQYSALDERIEVSTNEGVHGAYANFWSAISRLKNRGEDADYWLFCDQDDVWVEEKVEAEVKALMCLEEQYGHDCPLLVYSDLEITDEEGVPIGETMHGRAGIDLTDNPLNEFFSHTYVWGTSIAMNRALWDRAELPVYRREQASHDNWYPTMAILTGKISFIKAPLVRYRRHSVNVSSLPARGTSILDKMTSFGTQVNKQASIYWRSLEAIHLSGVKNATILGLQRCLYRGGVGSMYWMVRHQIWAGASVPSRMSRYFVLGLRLHKFTKWFHER